MKNLNKGFVLVVFLIMLVTVAIGGAYFLYNRNSKTVNLSDDVIGKYPTYDMSTATTTIISTEENKDNNTKTPVEWKVYADNTNKFYFQYPSDFLIINNPNELNYGRPMVTVKRGVLMVRIMIGPITTDLVGPVSYDTLKSQYLAADAVIGGQPVGDSIIVYSNVRYDGDKIYPLFWWVETTDSTVRRKISFIQRNSPYDYFETAVSRIDGALFTEEEDIVAGQILNSFGFMP